jgi:hypothetical protein
MHDDVAVILDGERGTPFLGNLRIGPSHGTRKRPEDLGLRERALTVAKSEYHSAPRPHQIALLSLFGIATGATLSGAAMTLSKDHSARE